MKKATAFVWVTLFLAISGCDKLTSFVEYFSPNKKITSAPSSSTAPIKEKSASAPIAPAPNALAQVGNWTITVDEFNERLKNLKAVVPEFDITDLDSQKLVLEELIRQQLLVIDAEQNGMADKKEIAQAVEEFRRTLLVREVVTKVTQDIKVTEDEAQKFYTDNSAEFVEPAQWHLREIVVDTQEQANGILADILKGADFSQTAKEKSRGKTAADGGDLGFVSEPGSEALRNVLASLEAGGVSSVFKSPDGFTIVKLEEKKGGQSKAFAEIKNEIMEGLTLMKQQQAIMQYLSDLQQKIPVKTNEGLLK